MRDAKAHLTPVRSSILKDLRSRLNEFKKKSGVIGGSLFTDAGHSYWWYLEYGTATRFIGDDGTLEKPSGISKTQGRATPYPITRGDQFGIYQSGPFQGQRYRKKLRFPYMGKIVYREIVMHPGARPTNQGKGVVRMAIRKGQIELERKLRGFKSRKKPPTRNELVRTLNEVLVGILEDVRRYTPRDPNSDNPTHLRDSWDIRKAS